MSVTIRWDWQRRARMICSLFGRICWKCLDLVIFCIGWRIMLINCEKFLLLWYHFTTIWFAKCLITTKTWRMAKIRWCFWTILCLELCFLLVSNVGILIVEARVYSSSHLSKSWYILLMVAFNCWVFTNGSFSFRTYTISRLESASVIKTREICLPFPSQWLRHFGKNGI
jgi:hypothetical protein